MFVKAEADSAYKILGISPTATDDEVKKAYRKMAVENHPDKVAYLGEDVQRAAKEKFQRINEAYEAIKKQRGFS
jgi:DnaJ like chaperone protein